MSHNALLPFLAALAAALLFCPPVIAGREEAAPRPVQTPGTETNADEWQFEAAPYGWMIGLSGDVGVGGVSTEIDYSFADVVERLDAAFLLTLQARKDRWMFVIDGLFLQVGGEGGLPGPIEARADVTMQVGILEGGIGYRIIDLPNLSVDLFGGLRWMSLETEIEASATHSAIEEFSRNLSSELLSLAGSSARSKLGASAPAVADSVRDELLNVRQTLETAVEAKAAQAKADIQSRAASVKAEIRSKVEARVGEILSQLPGGGANLPTSGPIRARIRELVDAVVAARGEETLAEIEAMKSETVSRINERKAALKEQAQERIAAAKARARGKASKAVKQAEKKLAEAIAGKVNGYFPNKTEASKNWLDPIVGLRARLALAEWAYLGAYGDIGGFGIGSDLTWQAAGFLGFQLSRGFALECGYRHLFVDYQSDDFLFRTETSGPFVGGRFNF